MGKIAFSLCSFKFNRQSSYTHYYFNLQGQKIGNPKYYGHWLSDGWVKKMVLHQNNGAGLNFAQSGKCIEFLEKPRFLESVSFLHEILVVTNF